MPDKVVGLFSTLLILVLAIVLPLFTVLKTLVEHHDPAFTFAVAIYVWYLFVAMTIGFTNFVAMANVRDECNRLFRKAIKDGRIFREAVENAQPPAVWSDKKALVTIFSITAAVVLIGIFVVLHIFAGCLPLRCFMTS